VFHGLHGAITGISEASPHRRPPLGAYRIVAESTEHGGYPLFDHLRKILDGPIATPEAAVAFAA
jgi:hypothetical protein